MYVAVFCSANATIDRDFFVLTEALGAWLASEGHTLVYGGCDEGLMGAIGGAVHRGGGRLIGVIPHLAAAMDTVAGYLDVTIPVATLAERKEMIIDRADLILALPGGVGTLDEIFTVVAAHTIGAHSKRVVLYNMKHFYDPLLALLATLQEQGMIRGDVGAFITAVSTLDEIKAIAKEM